MLEDEQIIVEMVVLDFLELMLQMLDAVDGPVAENLVLRHRQ